MPSIADVIALIELADPDKVSPRGAGALGRPPFELAGSPASPFKLDVEHHRGRGSRHRSGRADAFRAAARGRPMSGGDGIRANRCPCSPNPGHIGHRSA